MVEIFAKLMAVLEDYFSSSVYDELLSSRSGMVDEKRLLLNATDSQFTQN